MPLGQPDVAQDTMGIPNNYNSFQVDDVEGNTYEPGASRSHPLAHITCRSVHSN